MRFELQLQKDAKVEVETVAPNPSRTHRSRSELISPVPERLLAQPHARSLELYWTTNRVRTQGTTKVSAQITYHC
jgi:hypothetical protein